MIEIRCSCGARLKTREENAGKAVRCPKCQKPVKVPRSEPEAPPVVPEVEDAAPPVPAVPEVKAPATPQPEPRKLAGKPGPRRPKADLGEEPPTAARPQQDEEPEEERGPRRRPAQAKKKSRTLLLVILLITGFVVGGLLLLIGLTTYAVYWRGNSPAANKGAPAPAANNQQAGPPAVPDAFVLRPTFQTDRQVVAAGSAFVVRPEGIEQPVILTALHLMGPAGGYPFDVAPANIPRVVKGVTLRDMFGGTLQVHVGQSAIPIPNSAPLGKPSAAGDVMAFWAPKDSPLHPVPLAAHGARVGDQVWLAYSARHQQGQRVHRARVERVTGQEMEYAFDDPQLELPGTSGAPVLNAAGEVVGIQLGGGTDRGRKLGVANPVDTFRDHLLNACRSNPPRPPEPTANKEFTSLKWGFAVQFPSAGTAVTEKDERSPTPAGLVTNHLVSKELPDGTGLLVSVVRYPKGALLNVSDQDRLKVAMDNVQKELKGEMAAEEKLTKGSYPGLGRTMKVPEVGQANVQIFAVQDRLYQLLTLGPEQTPFAREKEQFLESFRILKK